MELRFIYADFFICRNCLENEEIESYAMKKVVWLKKEIIINEAPKSKYNSMVGTRKEDGIS
tara:strand:+ start:484 stop:666 length:183 start_codon:yes stop_codon:yes gene_type:complete